MNEILKIKDKIKALKLYLEANKSDDEGDSWIFGHNPIIVQHLNKFNKQEYIKLNSELVNWEDEIIGNLADPITECENEFIDGSYTYCLIFMQINNFEELEYLIQNLGAIIWEIKSKQAQEFYNIILNKAKEINKRLKYNYNNTVKQIEKIKKS